MTLAGRSVLVSCFLITAGITAGTTYTVTDLGANVEPKALNDSGEVVGKYLRPEGHEHAFLFSHGSMHDLGTLGGDYSVARGINASGVIVGSAALSPTAGGNPKAKAVEKRSAFEYSHGEMRALTSPVDGSSLASATDINASGDIVVGSSFGERTLLTHGTLVSLGTLIAKGTTHVTGWTYAPDGIKSPMVSQAAGYLVGVRINARGQVVGHAAVPDEKERAFLFADGTLHDLGAMDGSISVGLDLNDRGMVVGRYKTKSGGFHAFLYRDGHMTDLGIPDQWENSSAEGINSSGDVVVNADTSTYVPGVGGIDIESRPYLYRSGQWIDLSTQVDLHSAGLRKLYSATRINARGQIIGRVMGEKTLRGVLLTPIGSP